MNDPHFRDRGTLRPMRRQDQEAPVETGVVPGFPVVFSGGELPSLEGGARLGHHTEAILGTVLGLDEQAIARLRREGVI